MGGPSWGKGPVLSLPPHVWEHMGIFPFPLTWEHAGSVWQDEGRWLVLVVCSVAIGGRYGTSWLCISAITDFPAHRHAYFFQNPTTLVSLWCITLYFISTGKNSSNQYENSKALRNVTNWRPFSTGHILKFVPKIYQGNKKRRCLTKSSKAEHTCEDAFKRTI